MSHFTNTNTTTQTQTMVYTKRFLESNWLGKRPVTRYHSGIRAHVLITGEANYTKTHLMSQTPLTCKEINTKQPKSGLDTKNTSHPKENSYLGRKWKKLCPKIPQKQNTMSLAVTKH